MARDPISKRSRLDVRAGWLTALVLVAATLTLAGSALGLLIADGRYDAYVGLLIGGGIFLAGIAAWLAVPTRRKGPRTVGEILALEEHSTAVKAFAMLVRLFGLVAVVLLGIAALDRLGVLHGLAFEAAVMRRAIFLLVMMMAASRAFVQSRTLRRPAEHAPKPIAQVLQGVATVTALLLGLAAAYIAIRLEATDTIALGITGQDFPFLLLGAQVALAIATSASGALPSIASMLGSDKRADARGTTGKRNLVFLPVVFAFFLVFLVFMLFLTFGASLFSSIDAVANDPLLLGTVIFVLVAFVVSLAYAFRLARSEAKPAPLYKKLVDAKKRRERVIIGVSAAGSLVLLIPAFLLFSGYNVLDLATDYWVHFLCLGVLIALGPYGFYTASEARRIRLLEERFPDFLRDVASSHKGGLTLAQSVAVAARGEYGPLGPEVQRMADQLSWNVPFNEALERFGNRVQTPLVQRAVSLILEANRSGGATTDVLLAAARDAREIKTLEQDRRINMSLYTVVIYVTFFVFLGVTAVLYSQFVPQLVASSHAAQDAAARAGGGNIPGVTSGGLNLKDFQLFYFMAALMQGLGDGIVAGMMGSGKAVLGLRHSFIMVMLSYVTFVFLLT